MWQQLVKYLIAKRLTKKGILREPFSGLTIANEYGSGPTTNGHSQAVISTTKKIKYEKFQETMKKMTGKRIDYVQSCKNINDCIRYVTKEDYLCVNIGHDWDYCSLIVKADNYYKKHPRFNPAAYPYCNMQNHVQRSFKEYINWFQKEYDIDQAKWDDLKEYHWHKETLKLLKEQNSRQVLWIYDQKGNMGKTELANYIEDQMEGIIFNNGKTSIMAHMYNNEKIVVFDYTRDKQELINYSVLEAFKNGRIMAPKYDSRVRRFNPVKLICFANFTPDT